MIFEELLTTREVATMLNVHIRTVQKWRKKGKGPKAMRRVRQKGGQYVYWLTDVMDWIRLGDKVY